MAQRMFFISIDLPLNDNLLSLTELADRAFALAEHTSETSFNDIPCHLMLHRFAAILYTSNGHSDYSPVKAILRQNWPSRPVPVVVDFRAMTAVCEDQETHLAIGPEQIARAAEGIEAHIRYVWNRHAQMNLKDQLEHCLDWMDFLQSLKSSGILSANAYTLHFDSFSMHKQCPRCTTRASRCMLCRTTMCLNRACAVSRAIPFHSCSEHISAAICVHCWETGQWEWQPIIQCPHCKLWFCDSEVTWCFGRPSRDHKHSARPIGCFSCIVDQELPKCSSRECGSRRGVPSTTVCELCSPGGGVWCRCRRSWICDPCKEDEHGGFTQCSRCKKEYCHEARGCNYIGYCAICDEVALCDDCFEEDWSGFELGTDAKVVALGKCGNPRCWKRICGDCLERAEQCRNCRKTFCFSCLRLMPPIDCSRGKHNTRWCDTTTANPSTLMPHDPFSFDDTNDDDEGWQEMPVVREDELAGGLDEEDQRKYHYAPKKTSPDTTHTTGNATGNLIDFDDEGTQWRSKAEQNENEYTRLRAEEEEEADEVHLRTRYLFDEDKAMTPLGQMQTTKKMLNEAQRIAYVGLCALTAKEMVQKQKNARRKEFKDAIQNMELWALKVMGRLYYHMDLETAEQKMIDSLALHGVQASDLAPSLMTTHTIANPEYDPVEAKKQEMEKASHPDIIPESPKSPAVPSSPTTQTSPTFQTTARVLENTSVASSSLPGVSTILSSVDKDVTLDIRWTVLCDLFLILVADSVYDARSRVLLEHVALKLGLGWIDVVKFERRVTEALEIQEGVEKLENQEIIDGSSKAARKRRYMMLGLATLGGGLVIGLSAGLLAPVIGAGLGAAFTTVGISGTTGFLAGAGGAAVITTGGVLTGSGIAARGMARRTRSVRTFDVLPLHNNKRVSCILTVPGFMNGKIDDVRLPFSVLDPIVGDVMSVLWEPEMIQETGSAIRILTGEILTQLGQTVLQHTVMTALMGALQWPIILTKLGYLIDNPWNNALDRARAAGSVLAQLLLQRHLGVRPITLIGFSLGARVIFYALLELAKAKAFGIVQDVFILGATLTASQSTWCSARSAVSGRFVNAYAKNDWVLNYLFRATSGGLSSVAGLRPIEGVPGLENVDVTDKISGHMSYRTFMPLILDQLGFPVTADYFDEPVEPDFEGDRVVIREAEEAKAQKQGWFSKRKKPSVASASSRPPSAPSFGSSRRKGSSKVPEDDLPPRTDAPSPVAASTNTDARTTSPERRSSDSTPDVPAHAGFDLAAIRHMIRQAERQPEQLAVPQSKPDQAGSQELPNSISAPPLSPPISQIGVETVTGAVNQPVPYDDVDGVGSSSRTLPLPDGLNATFTTSLTLHDRDPYRSSKEDKLCSEPDSALSRQTFTPGAVWSSMRHANESTLGNSFAGSSEGSAYAKSMHNVAESPYTHDRLGVEGTQPAIVTSPGLSFGSPDGSITFQGMEPDPWSAPTEYRRGTGSGLGMNPWST